MAQNPMFNFVRRSMRIAGQREKSFFGGEMALKQPQQVVDRFQHGGGIPPINETGDMDDLIKNFFMFTVDLGITYRN